MSFNKVILVGNLGRDPELRYTPQGTPVCSFSMATNERRKDKAGEMQDQTTWFRVTLWGRQAETASQYLTKGRPVYIEGRLRVEELLVKQLFQPPKRDKMQRSQYRAWLIVSVRLHSE